MKFFKNSTNKDKEFAYFRQNNVDTLISIPSSGQKTWYNDDSCCLQQKHMQFNGITYNKL